MAELSDYAAPFLHGLQTGASIGRTIAENMRLREQQRRDLEQAQIANGIRERQQAIADAEASRKAAEYQGLVDFSNLVQSTPVPGGGDLSPQDQPAMEAQRRENLLQHLPPTLLPRALESAQSDYEREQRLMALQGAYNSRNQARIDERAAEQDKRITAAQDAMDKRLTAAQEAATKSQQAAMDRATTVQSSIDARAEARKNAKAEEFPVGSPAAIYENLLQAKDAGAQSGTVAGGTFTEKEPHWYNSAQPIEALIQQYETKVPAAAKRKIKARVQDNADQTVSEPAAVPVPTDPAAAAAQQTPAKVRVVSPDGKVIGYVPADKLDAALKKGYKRAD